jgi:hypothetical protein
MSFDPIQAGFAWPEETVLTNSAGQQMTLRPYAANFARIEGAGSRRICECYRYYTTESGILTELEVGHWLAGGEAECSRLCSSLKQLLSAALGPIALTPLIVSLRSEGFADVTISTNMRWLVQDGYVSAEYRAGEWSINNVRL